ncbi:MAG: Gfo/Idh/MocA family oxidoreductase [Edaphobacter sp.]|uniref:Gfo/Idh/MocA family oxidoreductase n=1 Tax=Edaphobacter sp. TaxID=1934404 RepID=UPI00238A72D6|nr:Gfo/Idh/MocA family oxidoreductase [Edaphobacter sp.]MDE1175544.1 Gfo/Idh/MocA family oxidoreductase [Edaphobacter sp.]
MAEINVAVIGFGLAGRVFHAPFVNAVPGLTLAAIVQRRGDEAQKAYPSARILRSFEEAIQDASIDLIVVGTPNETHYDLAKQALLAGKHVVIDKPFAATSIQARELIEIAAEKKLVLAPFHNRRWDGDFKTVRKILEAEELGRIATFESHFDRFRPMPREGTWKEAGNDANGMLFDLGPHLVDQVLALFGAPQGITASVRRDRDTTEIEDAFDITLHYPKLEAYCRATMIAADPAPRFLIHGTKGSFRKYGLDPQEPALVAGGAVPPVGDTRDWLSEPEEAWGTLTIAPDPANPGVLNRTTVKTERGDYRDYYASVRDAILGKAPLGVPSEDGYRVIRLLELARESSAKGKTMTVDFPV